MSSLLRKQQSYPCSPMSPFMHTPTNMIPITPPPREAVQVHSAPGDLQPRHAFGGPIPREATQPNPIDTIAAKDLNLQRPVPKADGAKFVPNSSSTGLLFRDNNSPATSTTFDSTESPTLFKTPNLVSNTTVSSSPLFGNNNTTTHNNTPMMDSPVQRPICFVELCLWYFHLINLVLIHQTRISR